MKFGDNLKKIRKSKKFSQEDLADRIGVTRQSVSKWETGEAYPEMNNILQLCKLFRCKINDLVNDSIIDIDSFDEGIKRSAVKFKEAEQKKMKTLSKIISVFAKIGRIVNTICIPIVLLTILLAPYFIKNMSVKEDELIWTGVNNKIVLTTEEEKVSLKYDNILIANADAEIVSTKYIDVFRNHSKMAIIGYIEAAFLTLLVTIILVAIILKHLEELFKNIYKGHTPFTPENVTHIKKMAWLMIAAILIPNIGGAIFSFLINVEIDFELFDLVQILFLFSMAYIFQYGYEIQLDSNGIMYEENRNKRESVQN